MLDKLSDGKMLFFEDMENAKSMRGPKHYHNAFEIYFMEKGECDYFIDDKLYHVREGDLVLIPEGTLHKTKYNEHLHARVLINCSRHYIPTDIAEELSALLHLYRNPSLIPQIRELLEHIRVEYHSPDRYSGSVLVGLLHFLFYTLVRHAAECECVGINNPLTCEAITYMKEHFANELRLSHIAANIGISAEHLSRLFKKETGFSFSELLMMIRLRQAESMLKGTPAPSISEAAFACGFNDSNYFSACFKKMYGYSPSALKRKK